MREKYGSGRTAEVGRREEEEEVSIPPSPRGGVASEEGRLRDILVVDKPPLSKASLVSAQDTKAAKKVSKDLFSFRRFIFMCLLTVTVAMMCINVSSWT
jgi:hypothetical protein